MNGAGGTAGVRELKLQLLQLATDLWAPRISSRAQMAILNSRPGFRMEMDKLKYNLWAEPQWSPEEELR